MVEGTAQRLDELRENFDRLIALSAFATVEDVTAACVDGLALLDVVRGQADALQAATDERDAAVNKAESWRQEHIKTENALLDARTGAQHVRDELEAVKRALARLMARLADANRQIRDGAVRDVAADMAHSELAEARAALRGVREACDNLSGEFDRRTVRRAIGGNHVGVAALGVGVPTELPTAKTEREPSARWCGDSRCRGQEEHTYNEDTVGSYDICPGGPATSVDPPKETQQ